MKEGRNRSPRSGFTVSFLLGFGDVLGYLNYRRVVLTGINLYKGKRSFLERTDPKRRESFTALLG